jgi:(2R)-ethylmalonyl-CoA mutase
MKAALVESHRERIARIESGDQVLVGVNRFTETEPSPLTGGQIVRMHLVGRRPGV